MNTETFTENAFKTFAYRSEVDKYKSTEESILGKLFIQQNEIAYAIAHILDGIEFQITIFSLLGYCQLSNSMIKNIDPATDIKSTKLRIKQLQDVLPQPNLSFNAKKLIEERTLGKLVTLCKMYIPKKYSSICSSLDIYNKKRNSLIHKMFSENFETFQNFLDTAKECFSAGEQILPKLQELDEKVSSSALSGADVIKSVTKKS